MKSSNTRIKRAAILMLTISFFGCTTTITRVKNPAFAVETKIVQDDLKKIVTCSNIGLEGTEEKVDGKISSVLKISIKNGKDIPTDPVQMKALGKTIASTIKKYLKDTNEYSKYAVLFVTVVSNSVTTEKTITGNEFSSAEL